jgi:hypothetical protein
MIARLLNSLFFVYLNSLIFFVKVCFIILKILLDLLINVKIFEYICIWYVMVFDTYQYVFSIFQIQTTHVALQIPMLVLQKSEYKCGRRDSPVE